MAEQSHQDVVTQSLSADASAPVDVSAIHATFSAARAAGDKPTTTLPNSLQANSDSVVSESTNGIPSSSDAPSQVFTNGKEIDIDHESGIVQDDAKMSQVLENALEEDSLRNLRGEGSVGSDTDTSKADAASEAKETAPRYAPKKPAGFKPVSVTKNFLAKAGSVSTPAKPSGEKSPATPGGSPALSTQPLPRPRLVAKSASGQRSSLPKTLTTASNNGLGNGPDPSQVWNKNRVQTPQAVPKQLTDEELRQQYGIQLASRPLEDENSNQAKWADIDDEDDWAPETIEWNDGTKVNLAESAAAVAAANATETTKSSADPIREEKPSSMESNESSVKPTSIGPNATVLKLGSGVQHKSSGSISKSTSDKPSLVSKPSSTTPAKSPWATLPVVEKVPPVQVNPSNPPVQNKFGHKDAHGFDAMPPPPPHAKEIEADDFSRFSRDHSGAQRELYVPQSGRYEPVRENRRQPSRNDGNFRQPSVLQRPSHGERDTDAPPGPSPAFQTNRSQQDASPWSRRRASSGVSGESGKFGRRMSIGRTYEQRASAEGARRGSQFEPSAHRDASPTHSHSKSVTSQSPTVSVAPDGTVANNTAIAQQPTAAISAAEQQAMPGEDPVALQKRLMREKREAAIKRRQEEEAKAESEKRERIRIKMEQLGMSPDAKPEKKEKETRSEELKAKQLTDETNSRATVPEPLATRITSPPKPPVPNASGEPQQYGLMKVHAPQPAHVTSPRAAGVVPSKPSALASQAPETGNNLRSDPKVQLPNGDHVKVKPEDQANARSELNLKEATSSSQPWSSVSQQPPPTGLGGWSANTMGSHAPPTSNLWGPPSNHRALGNGDFQHNLPRSSMKPTQQSYPGSNASAAPQPIGTPRQHPSNRKVTAPGKPDLLAGNLIDDLQGIPSLSPPDTIPHRPEAHPHGRGGLRPNHEQSSLPPNVPVSAAASQIEQSQAGLGAWTSFSANNGRLEVEQAARDRTARLADPGVGLPRTNDQLPVLQETWKKVSRSQDVGQRHVIGTSQVTSNYATGQPSQPQSDFHRGNGPAAPHARSRFQDIFEHQKGTTVQSTFPRPPSPSMPPPDSDEHPAYVGGDHQRPLVNLPGSRARAVEPDRPIVKLPPTKDYAQSAPTPPAAPARVQSWSGVVKQSTVSQTWQDRINGLWAPKGAPSPAVQTASKPRFDLHPLESSLAISLPPKSIQSDVVIPERLVEEDEALFEEEREFGSIPTTKLADIPAHHPAWTPAPRPDLKDKRVRTLRDDTIFSVLPSPLFAGDELRGTTTITVMVGSMSAAVVKTVTRDLSQGARRGTRQSGRRNPYRNSKPREASTSSPNGGESTSSKDVAPTGARTVSRGFKPHKPYRGSRNGPSSPVARN